MNKQEATRVVEAYGASYGITTTLNEKGLGGMEINGGLIYFEFEEAAQSLKVSALIYKFTNDPKPGILEGFKAEQAAGTDAGGGKVDYETENKGLYLAKTYQIVPVAETFETDVKRLLNAAKVWGNDVLDRVSAKVFKH